MSRNQLLITDTVLSVFACSLGLGSFVGSIFGMNLVSHWEQVGTRTFYWELVSEVFLSCFVSSVNCEGCACFQHRCYHDDVGCLCNRCGDSVSVSSLRCVAQGDEGDQEYEHRPSYQIGVQRIMLEMRFARAKHVASNVEVALEKRAPASFHCPPRTFGGSRRLLPSSHVLSPKGE